MSPGPTSSGPSSSGPLAGLRVVELAGLGPAPFAAMLLADLGADVVRVDRPGRYALGDQSKEVLNRNRRSLAVDLKSTAGRDLVLDLVARSDVLLEGYRPGVTERLGLGPADCSAVNPRLVYGRMTGWGQEGPLAQAPGHDIDYIAITGALWATGRPPDRPVPPMNLVGDFGGGAMFLAFGVMCAVYEARSSGLGQVVDAAMVDGTALLTAMMWQMRAQGVWGQQRGANILDGGAPFYDVYECADGQFIAVGAIEPQFYAELVARTGFEVDGSHQLDPAGWPDQKKRWAALFATRTRDEWAALLEGTGACAAPVLSWDEAPQHPHLAARGTFVEVDGVQQPAPAPRFSRSVVPAPGAPAVPGAHTDEVLTELGFGSDRIAGLRADGVIG